MKWEEELGDVFGKQSKREGSGKTSKEDFMRELHKVTGDGRAFSMDRLQEYFDGKDFTSRENVQAKDVFSAIMGLSMMITGRLKWNTSGELSIVLSEVVNDIVGMLQHMNFIRKMENIERSILTTSITYIMARSWDDFFKGRATEALSEFETLSVNAKSAAFLMDLLDKADDFKKGEESD